MTNLTYNLTRQQAAQILGISTRTLDRRIRKGILSYKKQWKVVLLSEEEVLAYKKKMSSNWENNVVYQWAVVAENTWNENVLAVYQDLEEKLNENFSKFLKLLEEKDKLIESKNKIIFALQHKLGEYESKLKNMIALPDYTKEKEKILLEKERLEIENKTLLESLKREKIYKYIFVFISIILLLIVIFLNVR